MIWGFVGWQAVIVVVVLMAAITGVLGAVALVVREKFKK